MKFVNPLALYLHVPFCTTKCSYCAFNTYINLEHLIPVFVDALCREISLIAGVTVQKHVGTVFFGGGTPTLLSPAQLGQVLETVKACFELDDRAEISLEANPNDLSLSYAQELLQVGFNRISIGMQTADAGELVLFRRRHDNDAVVKAVSAARMAGFRNINLDLIYGVPHQSLDSWTNTVQQALALRPTHLSLYALTVEESTPMYSWVERGVVPTPDDDLAADMYEQAEKLLAEVGFVQYEISNWSLPGMPCEHNLQYWRSLPYLGFGPGAHGFADGVRYSNLLSPHQYIRQIMDASSGEALMFPISPAVQEWTRLESADEIAETLIMGLRLVDEGIDLEQFTQRFGRDLLEIHGDAITRFIHQGLLILDEGSVRLTARGRLLSNIVFREFV